VSVSTTSIDLRCDANPKRLFAKVKRETGAPPPVDADTNLIEVTCKDCLKAAHRDGELDVVVVYHRFNVVGETFTEKVRRGQSADTKRETTQEG